MMKNKGFTLIELLFIIVIMGILIPTAFLGLATQEPEQPAMVEVSVPMEIR